MKTRNKLVITAIFILLSSCEKVIYVDLNTVNPIVVVQGNITDLPGPYTVQLNTTVDYYDPNVFPAVTGAKVTVSDNAGNSEVLKETSPGIYQTSTLQGVIGRTYSLNIVTSGGAVYTAQSTMPDSVPIDSVNFMVRDRDSTFRTICKFKDPGLTIDYYKLQITSKDTAAIDTTSIRILENGLAAGQELSITYGTHFILGDTVTAMLECIDLATYNFYSTIVNVEGGIGTALGAPPENPLTNISNGGLGYFSAHTVSEKSAVVQ